MAKIKLGSLWFSLACEANQCKIFPKRRIFKIEIFTYAQQEYLFSIFSLQKLGVLNNMDNLIWIQIT